MDRTPEERLEAPRPSGTDRSATIVLPTYRRPQGLARVLQGLRDQVDPGVPWDVVIVDNDQPSASVQQAVASVAEKVPAHVRLVNEGTNGSAHARNRGIGEAEGSIVVFVDDDVQPEPTWLRELLAPILAGRCEGTGGRVLVDPSVARPWWYREEFDWHMAELDLGDVEADIGEGYVVTASAAFELDLIRRVGGFDPVLGPRRGVQLVNDDVSICRRFIAAGGRIRYVPTSVVIHELPPARLQIRFMLRRLHSQGRSDWLIDRHELAGVPWMSKRGAVRRLGYILRGRVRTGALRNPVWTLCQIAWAAGFIREALSAKIARRSDGEDGSA